MARSLTFSFNGSTFECEISKVDRSKLYGQVSIETLDVDKRRCSLATLAYDGKTVIPYGGTALGYMNPDGEWLSRDDLSPIDPEGNPLEEVESSFKVTIELDKAVSVDEYLDHSVRLCYQLDASFIDPACKQALDAGAIYQFQFSYRGGVSVDPAFILSNDEAVWMMVTNTNLVEYASLANAAVCTRLDEPEETREDSEELDFGML